MAQISRDRSLYHGSLRPARPAESLQRLMSASGQLLPKGAVHPMSAFPPIATVERTCEEVRFVPTRDSSIAAKSFLFDHLVCADKQEGRHSKAEFLGRLQIDNQLKFGRLLNRQIGRLGAFENLIDVADCTAEQIE
jgi:hypothetical protein